VYVGLSRLQGSALPQLFCNTGHFWLQEDLNSAHWCLQILPFYDMRTPRFMQEIHSRCTHFRFGFKWHETAAQAVYLSFFSIQFLHDLASTRILRQGHVNVRSPHPQTPAP